MWGRGQGVVVPPPGLVEDQIALMVDRVNIVRLEERIAALDRIMEARFVRVEELTRFQAEKVALALAASQQAIDKADGATEKAIIKAEIATDKRFESVNEFRKTLSDQTATFVPRAEFTALKEKHAEDIITLKERLDKAEGRQGGVANVWGVIVAVVGIAIAVGALVFRNM